MKVFHLTDFDSCFVWRVGIMRHTLFLTLSFVSLSVLATSVLNVSEQYGAFALVSKGKAATIYVSDQELTTVRKVTELFADDVERVSGFRPQMAADATTASVVVATVGHSGYIDQLVSKHQLDLSSIQGGWEQYMIKVIGRQLVIVGSDRRGAAYGLLTLSEKIGVSPWYWWTDVPVVHHDALFVDADYVSQEPTIKYRGIFINDEDWGLKTWASQNFEKELGDIGPKTYDRVCELILRLKGNMLAPAMHSCTGAFYSHPESQVVADSWGVMITTSHCEPLLFNNAALSEWDKARDGEWNYETNSATILRKLDNRIRETAQYDNIYTMGLRGLHDEAMKGSKDPQTRARTLEKVIDQQRQILEKYKQRKADELPQIFVPYKETLDIYDAGLRVPEDITLVWPDDNYGYMKRVSNAQEQQRKGGSGVYYHLSYLGTPHDYLWIASTAPMLMYEELLKAYTAGANRYWLLNVGDIKPMEMEVQHFFDMAYDFRAFSYDSVNSYQAQWLAKVFGDSGSALSPQPSDLAGRFQFILDNYYRLAWDRKPEFMGYEYEWSSMEENRLHDTDFSFETGSAQKRLADYQDICNVYDSIEHELPAAARPALFELLGYAVHSAYQMNRKFLYAQRNHETGNADDAEMSQEAYREIDRLRQRYHTLFDGKWDQMISEVPPGFCAKYQQMPEFSDKPTKSYRLPDDQLHPELPYQISLTTLHLTEPFRLLEGVGTDWVALQMGQPLDFDTTGSIDIPLAPCALPLVPCSLTLCLSVVPVWPVAYDRSNRFEVSVDGGKPQVCENVFQEWGPKWKKQVLENRKEFVLTFPLDQSRQQHVITLSIVDPGQIIQKITYDYK
jgi:hypothetical protein